MKTNLVWVNSPHGMLSVDSLVLEACGFQPNQRLTSDQAMHVMAVNAHYMIGKIEAEIARRKAAGLPVNGE